MPENESIQTTASYTIKIDGKSMPQTNKVLSIRVQNEINKVPTANLIILDGNPATNEFETGNSDFLIPSKIIEIFIGSEGNDTLLFKGIVIKHGIELRSSGMARLNVLCKDVYVKTTICPRRKYFNDKKDKAVIEDLFQTYSGLEIEVADTATKHLELIQYDVSDFDFAIMRAEVNGMICTVESGKMKVLKPNFTTEPIFTATYGINILDIEAQIDARNQFSSIITKTWDYADQAEGTATANEPTINKIGNLAGTDISKTLNGTAEWKHSGKIEPQELQAFADAALLKQRMSAIRGRVRFFGNAKIKTNTIIELKGLSDRFNGKAWVSGVQHRIEEGIWTTDVQFGWSSQWFIQENDTTQVAPPPLIPPLFGLQIAVVNALEGDPDGEGRIQVKMPMIDPNAEGAWARIASLDAGKERGFHFRPDIGDEVVVGFLQNDPRDCVVLGGLHSSNKPSPFKNEDKNNIKGYVSKSKMSFSFDDEKKIITLKTKEGNEIILSEDEKKISIIDQNSNKIIMSEDGIQIESSKDLILKATGDVKIEGVNIENSASSQYKAEGKASAELSSSGSAILNGKPVLINC